MVATKPKYKIKEKKWELYWSPLPMGVESSTGAYPERVVFATYCDCLKFYNAIKAASKIK